jgi:hypothetical protein
MNEKEGAKSKVKRYEIRVKNGIKLVVCACDKKELDEKVEGIEYESIDELRDRKKEHV